MEVLLVSVSRIEEVEEGGAHAEIEYATDVKDAYPDKPVTLLHSRERVLPKFHPSMHEQSRLSAASSGGIGND